MKKQIRKGDLVDTKCDGLVRVNTIVVRRWLTHNATLVNYYGRKIDKNGNEYGGDVWVSSAQPPR
jgi:hypothetical protein